MNTCDNVALGGQSGQIGLRTQPYPENPIANPKYPITINSVLNGFVVNVGCQTVVFESKDKMFSEIGRYLDNPEAVIKEYMEKK
jgi:hypothetical protein